MAKKRSIVTLGPSKLSLATTGVGSWVPFGPTRADRIYGQAIFSAATAGNVTLQGALTTASTNDWFTVLQRTQAQTAITASTVNKLVARLRLKSTSLSSGTVDMVYGGTTLSRDFLPTDLPGLVAWYDASRITGLSDGAAVAQWDDLSGNGNHLTQGTASFRPIYKVNIINGLPIVRFDGTDDFLSVTGLPARTAQSIYVVMSKRSAPDASGRIALSLQAGFGAGLAQFSGGGGSATNWLWSHNEALGNEDTLTAAEGMKIISLVVASASSMSIYDDGALAVTFNPRDLVTTDTELHLAGEGANPSNDVDCAELVVDSVAHDAAIRATVHAYLGSKYAISVS